MILHMAEKSKKFKLQKLFEFLQLLDLYHPITQKNIFPRQIKVRKNRVGRCRKENFQKGLNFRGTQIFQDAIHNLRLTIH